MHRSRLSVLLLHRASSSLSSSSSASAAFRTLSLSLSRAASRGVIRPHPRTIQHIYSSPSYFRSFGSAAAVTGKAEPFLNPQEVTERIIEVIKGFEKVNAAKVTATARFKDDLELDSLDAVEVVMAIEEEFAIEIPDAEADKILSVADAVTYVSQHPMAK